MIEGFDGGCVRRIAFCACAINRGGDCERWSILGESWVRFHLNPAYRGAIAATGWRHLST